MKNKESYQPVFSGISKQLQPGHRQNKTLLTAPGGIAQGDRTVSCRQNSSSTNPVFSPATTARRPQTKGTTSGWGNPTDENTPGEPTPGKAISPMQCAELVFGNLTNFDLLSADSSSHDHVNINSKKSREQSNFFSQKAFSTEQFDENEEKQKVVESGYDQMTTEQLIQMATKQASSEIAGQGLLSFHTRSKTMPEPSQVELPEQHSTLSKYSSTIAQLKQENMILAAEKYNMQAELIFYKNELAKHCLRTGSKFPIFRRPETESVGANSQILSKNQKSMNTENDLANPVMIVNPHMFYNSKQTSSESHYVCISQGIEDQVSSNLSNMRTSKSTAAFTVQKNTNNLIKNKATSYENLQTAKRVACKKAVFHKSLRSGQSSPNVHSKKASITSLPRKLSQADEGNKLTIQSDAAISSHLIQSPASQSSKKVNKSGQRLNRQKTKNFVEKENSQIATKQQPQLVTVNLRSSQQSNMTVVTNSLLQKSPSCADQLDNSTILTPSHHRVQLGDGSQTGRSQQQRRRRSERAGSRQQSSQLSRHSESKSQDRNKPDADFNHPQMLDQDLPAEDQPDAEESKRVKMVEFVENNIQSESNNQKPSISKPQKTSGQDLLTLSGINEDLHSLSALIAFTEQHSQTPSYVPSQIKYERIEQENFSAKVKREVDVSCHEIEQVDQKEDELIDSQNVYRESQEPTLSALSSQQIVEQDLNVYEEPVFSPLRQKEKLLESSHKELKAKLAKVREEINQLSEKPESVSDFGTNSPERFGSTKSLSKQIREVNEKTVEEKKDLIGIDKKAEVEDELNKLRLALQTYNHEEKKVLLELEITRTLRKAHERGNNNRADLSQTSDSFQLQPLKLNFENCSQKSNLMLASPVVNPFTSSAFKLTQYDMSQSDCKMGATERSSEEKSASLTSSQAYPGAPEPHSQSDFREAITIEEQSQEVSDSINIEDQKAVIVYETMKPKQNYMSTGNNGLQFSQIIEEDHESESAADNSACHSRCASNMQNNKVIVTSASQSNEVVEEYTDFINEAKTGVQMNNQLQRVSERTSSTPCDHIFDNHNDIALFNDMPDDSESFVENPSSTNNAQSTQVINLKLPAQVDQSQKHSFKESQTTKDRKVSRKSRHFEDSNANNLQKFEKLIKETQQADEGSLLRHIQRNLEQLQSAGDLQTRFALLQQQQSPSPLKNTRGFGNSQKTLSKKYLDTADQDCSVDTQRLIQDYQREQEMENAGNKDKTLAKTSETNGIDKNTQMSETIQFLAAAGQTQTTNPIVTNRSSANQNVSQQQTEDRCKMPDQNSLKSRNGVSSSNQSSHLNYDSGKSAPSIVALGECQIKILQNPAAAETMTSGGAHQILSSQHSIDMLSKASPYFQEHTSFEQTKQFNNRDMKFGTQESFGTNNSQKRDVSFNGPQSARSGACQSNQNVVTLQRSIFDDQRPSMNDSESALSIEKVHSQPIAIFAQRNQSDQTGTTFAYAQQDVAQKEAVKNSITSKSAPAYGGLSNMLKSFHSSQATKEAVRKSSFSASDPVIESQTSRHLYTNQVQARSSMVSPHYTTAKQPFPSSSSKTDQKDQTAPKIKKSMSQSQIQSSQDKSSQSINSEVYGNIIIAAAAKQRRMSNHCLASSLAKTKIQTRKHQQQIEQNTSDLYCETRSSFNIYKRNSVIMLNKNQDDVEIQNDMNRAVDGCSLTPVHAAKGAYRKQKRNIDVSDTQMLHAASQSTLNLDQRSPFTLASKTPSTTTMTKVNSNVEQRMLKQSQSVKEFAHGSVKDQKGNKTQPRRYEESYADYINGTDAPFRQSDQGTAKATSNKQSFDFGSHSKVVSRQIVKTKSMSNLCGQKSTVLSSHQKTALLKASPCLSKRLQEVASTHSLAGQSTRVTQTNLLANTPQAIYNSLSSRIQPGSMTVNNVRSQRSSATLSAHQYSGKFDETSRVQSANSNDQRNTVVLFQEGQPQKQTPSYMQPIQQKFRKQTLKMVQDKEARFTVSPSASQASQNYQQIYNQVMPPQNIVKQAKTNGRVPFKSQSVIQL